MVHCFVNHVIDVGNLTSNGFTRSGVTNAISSKPYISYFRVSRDRRYDIIYSRICNRISLVFGLWRRNYSDYFHYDDTSTSVSDSMTKNLDLGMTFIRLPSGYCTLTS